MATIEKTAAAAGPVPHAASETGRAWLAVVVAALAMVATLPGRTHGLGLITEPLLKDLGLDRVDFALVNLWATLLGAAFCLPCGWLIDRLGARTALLGVTLGLAATVVGMGQAEPAWGTLLLPGLFVLVLLTRGLGQSALSVVSLALMGRSVGRKPGLGVGVYSFVTALGFMAAFGLIKYVLEKWEPGWRPLWVGIGAAVAAFGLAAFVVVRPSQKRTETADDPDAVGLNLWQTLRTPAFWVFAGATSLYGMIAAGVSLFNQSILDERGFDRGVFLTITMLGPLVGLAANLATGWLGRWVAPGRLLAASMLLLMAALLCFPLVRSLWHVYLYAAAMGVAGGMVTVIFFGVWGQAFGTAHLGKVQGAAQMLTVLASAAGPLLLAAGQRASGSYVPVFQCVAAVAGLFGVAAWLVPLPQLGGATRRPGFSPRSREDDVATATVSRRRHSYEERGFVVVRGLLAPSAMSLALDEAVALCDRHDLINKDNLRCRWQTNVRSGECQFETFDPVIDLSPACRALAEDAGLLGVLAELYGEPASLFKDKLIYKPPGCPGYGLHQDWIGWPSFPRSFMTVLVPLEAADASNGCTVAYPGYHTGGSLSPEDGQYHPLPAETVDEAVAVPLTLEPGDVAIFGGFTPHRSEPNRSDRWRRQLFLSYNKLSDGGEQRAKHYDEFHAWLRKRYAEHGRHDVYFQ